VVPGDGRGLYKRALDQGWEGLIAKHVDSIYHTGKRTHDWRKLKILREQEFVVGGWTESRTTGRPFGALLLGYYNGEGELIYAGHTGTGFDGKELDRVFRLLKPLEISAPPFKKIRRPNEPPHWTKPKLVAQIKFTEWTDDGVLRHPVYLGMRDDVTPESVRREAEPTLHGKSDRVQSKEQKALGKPTSARGPSEARSRRAGGPE
jgi:bifunctional non-homologous end joining protein LigD